MFNVLLTFFPSSAPRTCEILCPDLRRETHLADGTMISFLCVATIRWRYQALPCLIIPRSGMLVIIYTHARGARKNHEHIIPAWDAQSLIIANMCIHMSTTQPACLPQTWVNMCHYMLHVLPLYATCVATCRMVGCRRLGCRRFGGAAMGYCLQHVYNWLDAKHTMVFLWSFFWAPMLVFSWFYCMVVVCPVVLLVLALFGLICVLMAACW